LQLPESFSVQFIAAHRSESKQQYVGIANVWKEGNDWSIEAISSKEGQTFHYANGITNVYMFDDKKCQAIQTVSPPFASELTNSLYQAQIVPADARIFDTEVRKCKQKWTTTFAGEHFVLCDLKNFIPAKILGQDIVIEITSYSFELAKIKEQITDKFSRCSPSGPDAVFNAWEIPYVAPADSSWYLSPTSCDYEWTRDTVACSGLYRSDDSKKVCIFLHGAGVAETKNATHRYRSYWGDVHKNTPQCSERWFVKYDTKMNGWDSVDMQKAYCDLALVGQQERHIRPGFSQRPIKNKIIFAHSMGNLVLAAAIKNNYCTIDETTSWYAANGPFMGSQASTWLTKLCNDKEHGGVVFETWRMLQHFVANVLGFCIKGGRPLPVFVTNDKDFCNKQGLCVKELRDIAKTKVKGSICGDSSSGLLSYMSVPLTTFSSLVSYHEPNDAIVPYSSCAIQDSYGTNFSALSYRTETNHMDGACRTGDGMYGAGRKPCSWYRNKV
jgi:hypothetical protein